MQQAKLKGMSGAELDELAINTIRTLTIANDVILAQAGGGIVADSAPEMEYQESLNKARAVVRAIERARGV